MTRVKLSQGAPAVFRIVALPAGVCMVGIEALLLWITIDQIPRFFPKENHGVGAALALITFLILVAVALYVVGALAFVCLRLVRTRFWLKGTVLVRRGVVAYRRIDLRAARVELRTPGRDRELVLVATDPQSGKSLDLLVQRGQMTLPAPEIAALAGAIIGDQQSARPASSNYAEATAVADTLRQIVVIE